MGGANGNAEVKRAVSGDLSRWKREGKAFPDIVSTFLAEVALSPWYCQVWVKMLTMHRLWEKIDEINLIDLAFMFLT